MHNKMMTKCSVSYSELEKTCCNLQRANKIFLLSYFILGDVYSQKVLDSCDVSIVPMLSSAQHRVKVSETAELYMVATS